MSPGRLPIELVDVDEEADAIAAAFAAAMEANDVRTMRQCFGRLVRNHRCIVHILTELCEEVAQMKGPQ